MTDELEQSNGEQETAEVDDAIIAIEIADSVEDQIAGAIRLATAVVDKANALVEAERAQREAEAKSDRLRGNIKMGLLSLLAISALLAGFSTYNNSQRIDENSRLSRHRLCQEANRIGEFAILANIESGEALITIATADDEPNGESQAVAEEYRQLLQARLNALFESFKLDCSELTQ